MLKSGGVLFVDELNARLHPLLVRTFVIAFSIENQPKACPADFYLSHEPWQLSSKMLRRDEVWFTEKADTGISTLYSLADFIDEDGTKNKERRELREELSSGKIRGYSHHAAFRYV